jgi:hypothetical protein
LAIAGPVADWVGVQGWFVVAGVVSLLMAVAAPFMRSIMHLEDAAMAVAAQPTPVSDEPEGLKLSENGVSSEK